MRRISLQRRTGSCVEMLESRSLFDSAAYHLTFDDEFNTLNLATGAASPGWLTTDVNSIAYLGHEQEYYCLQNGPSYTDTYNPFSVSNGVLSITARPNLDALGNPIVTTTTNPKYPTNTQPYLSGMLTTSAGSSLAGYPHALGFVQKYGYFELRAKLPDTQGMWPAFWLMPADATGTAEYDIFEVPIKSGSTDRTANDIYQTVHWGGYSYGDPHVNAQGYDYDPGTVNAAAGFHTYGFEWTPSTVTWYVDGVATQTQINRCDKAMYILINLAVGGDWPGNVDVTTTLPASMDLDYVRVYSTDPDVPAVTPQTGYQSTLPAAVGTVDALGATYPGLSGGSFETSFTTSGYTANPTGTPWTFTGTSGIAQNHTGSLNIPNAPDGYQAAVLQNTGSFSQTFTIPASLSGSYALSFKTGSRGFSNNDIQVFVDGVSLGTYTPPSQGGYDTTPRITPTFTLSGGSHTVAFTGKTANRVAFVDAVRLNVVTVGGITLLPPTGLTASIPTGTPEGQVVLSWTNPAGSNATGYVIERKANGPATAYGGGYYGVIATITDPSITTYTDAYLSSEPIKNSGVTYSYRVSAINSSIGNATSAYSELASPIAMPVPDPTQAQTPLAPATNLSATAVGGRTIKLVWRDPSYYSTGYIIERKIGAAGTWSTLATITGGASYRDINLLANTTYYYRVTTKGESISTSNVVTPITAVASAETSATTPANTAPQAPTSVIAVSGGFTTATITWSDPGDVPVSGYYIYRGTTAGGESSTPINATLIAGKSFVDTGLAYGVTYYYKIQAVNAYGASPLSAEAKTIAESASGMVAFDDALQNGFTYSGTTAPTLVNSPVYSGTAAFGGTEAVAGNSIGLRGAGGSTPVPAGQTILQAAVYLANGASVGSFVINMVNPGTPAVYTYNKTFTNANSSVWTVDGNAGTTTLTAGVWHIVRLDLSAAFTAAQFTPGRAQIINFYATTSIANQTIYVDEVKFVPKIAPATPTNLQASVAGSSIINLSWTASPGDQALYNVYRSTSPGGEGANPINATPLSGTSYTDGGLTAGTTYYYTVKAFNAAGTSAASTEVSASTWSAAPAAVSFQINDGSVQRSMVSSLALFFDQPVTLASGAVTLTLRGGGTVELLASPAADRRSYTLSFPSSSMAYGSLPDGVYDLQLQARLIRDEYGQTLGGGDRSYSFQRLYGDYDGNGRVTGTDYYWFKDSYGLASGASHYLWYLDYDGNGRITGTDYYWFKLAYGTSLSL